MECIPSADRSLIRALAGRVAEIAAEPRMEAVRQRWRDVNALRRPDRAPVWCRPVGCWRELLPEDALVATDPTAREIERALRQILIKADIGDDTPVEPVWRVPARFRVTPANTWGVDIRRQDTADEGGSWAYDPPLKEPADWERLTLPSFALDADAAQRDLEQADALLGDILPVQLEVAPALSGTLCNPAAALRGLEQILWDMAVAPDRVHALMALVRDATLRSMDAAEASGLLTPNNYGPMTESDPVGLLPSDGHPTLKQCWCAANSQEFDQVSPRMWKEFLLDYQMPIFARYGLVAYGCCENLTRKIDGVLSIPNLRVFVCSAWTNLDTVLERVGTRYCIMWRQKASDVVLPDDLDSIGADLESGLRRLQGFHYQVVLRELQTLAGHPRRLHDWTRLAIERAAKYA